MVQQINMRLQQYTEDNYNNTHGQPTAMHNGTINKHELTTIHTRQLQQYTRPTNNNYTQDNLKLATVHTRQITIYY